MTSKADGKIIPQLSQTAGTLKTVTLGSYSWELTINRPISDLFEIGSSTSTFLPLFAPSAYEVLDSILYLLYNSPKYKFRIKVSFWQI
jgi:hypothetical protein